MIDIFVKEKDSHNISVFFVQLGCIYDTTYAGLRTLCDNVVTLYVESNTRENGDIDYQYLPVTIYNNLFKNEDILLFEHKINENTQYAVKKVC